ncbi:hypothetical protein SAY87_022737 [Trapa incisa]|uniref:Calmodulin-binding family protein n=1 Tax=Trapa incisa TaxID=236973 RepID=A0AAN7K7N2_9MYRT|nr:hypothetical protein SAY87_022737 [Trapa incisa]
MMSSGSSLSFNGREFEALFAICSPSLESAKNDFARSESSNSDKGGSQDFLGPPEVIPRDSYSPSSPMIVSPRHHEAALKLQKVYKSFRTRRLLADCAVLVEQRWWKLLDFAELKRSSISFFDIERPETAISRWSRARTKAAKVGKGLSKDEKAKKLALQHWLEAIDPRHRYGHNLQFYYARWLHCDSKQPFFYWLDIGEGKETNLDWCSRQKLQQQCIKYLGPVERKAYEVVVEAGKFLYRQTGKLLDTREGPEEAKWIFVLSTSKVLYVGLKNKGTFQHSSFLAGGATLSAGRLVVEEGTLKAVWPHSGHYLPTEENFQEFMSFLEEQKVDLSNVKKSPTEEEEAALFRRVSNTIPSCLLDDNRAECIKESETQKKSGQDNGTGESSCDQSPSTWSWRLRYLIRRLRVLSGVDQLDTLGEEAELYPGDQGGYDTGDEDGHEDEFMVSKLNLFDEKDEDERVIPREKITSRIDSHKGMKSYQLAQQLSCKWTTGAGPRIGCMRDYPTELQAQVLEKANLSPRAATVNLSPRPTATPTRSRFGTVSSATSSPSCSRDHSPLGRVL